MKRKQLSHIDSKGKAKMVDVGTKPVSRREAVAAGSISMSVETLRAIADGKVPKGEVLGTARLAGIMAAKNCGNMIPLCHPLPIESVEVDFDLPDVARTSKGTVTIGIRAVARITAKTGVEMESLTAVAVAGLTIYDMCKAIDKAMVISEIRLLKKSKTPV